MKLEGKATISFKDVLGELQASSPCVGSPAHQASIAFAQLLMQAAELHLPFIEPPDHIASGGTELHKQTPGS